MITTTAQYAALEVLKAVAMADDQTVVALASRYKGIQSAWTYMNADRAYQVAKQLIDGAVEANATEGYALVIKIEMIAD
jgi:hypothetical protein